MDQTQINGITSELAQALRNKQKFGAPITDKYIEDSLSKLVHELQELPHFMISNEEVESIKFKLGSMFNITVGEEAITLHNPDIVRWFDSRKSEIEWKYWNAYKGMLESQARSIDVINANEKVIDSILDFSGDPKTIGPWARKGLVMGNVQSGKTQNYLGLINKAVDCGYKVIILLGGHLNDLRKQTQERVDEGVIGRESKHLNQARNTACAPIGVGNLREDSSNVHSFTTTAGDFKKPFANSLGVHLTGLSEPAIFTIKKHTTVMQSLYEWIKDHHFLNPESGKLLDLPMLLIDDEADYASVNTKAHKEEVTRTNEYIRKLISLFKRNTYIGYTATPFANIFIDPSETQYSEHDDLFPSDFMVKIPVPENYLGQDFFFTDDHESTVIIDDYDSIYGLKSEDMIHSIPESLREAVRAFILVIATRSLRGDKHAHNTMLVNVSHLKIHQDKLEFIIGEYVQKVVNALEVFSGLGFDEARRSPVLKSLEETFYSTFSVDETYENIFEQLTYSVGKLKVWAINQNNKRDAKSLDYSLYEEYGLCVIVIGGHKLSRGLTLDGLSISYFARNSKAYDTLMQMCRWFGYRPRYTDLCKVYLPYESLTWYEFISTSIRELYSELDLMSRMEKRPSEFGLKVRDHPGAMIITAKNKMGTAESEVRSQDLWGQVQRRFRFRKKPEINLRNMKYAERFIMDQLKEKQSHEVKIDKDTGVTVISNVPYQAIIEFIKNIELPEDDVGNLALIKHLKGMSKSDISKAKVAIFNQEKSRKVPWEDNLSEDERTFINSKFSFAGENITLAKRRMKSDGAVYSTPSAQLGNRDDEKIFLSEDARNIVRDLKNEPLSFDYICSEERDFPGLIIYLFAVGVVTPFRQSKDCKGIDSVELGHGKMPTLGYSVSLPRPENLRGKTSKEIAALIKDTRHSYQTNKVYQEQLALIDIFEEEDIE